MKVAMEEAIANASNSLPQAPQVPSPAPLAPSPALAPPELLPSPAAPVPPAAPEPEEHQRSSNSKKRKLENGELQNSKYFKIRALLRDLRPSFIEVLRAPDFRDCRAAHDIRRQIMLMVELSKQLKIETDSSGKYEKPTEGHTFAGECEEEPVEKKLREEEKHVEQPQPEGIPNVYYQIDKVWSSSELVPEKAQEETESEAKDLEKQLQGLRGTYAVGGSPIGWNFFVYPGGRTVYYGVTKAAARLRRTTR